MNGTYKSSDIELVKRYSSMPNVLIGALTGLSDDQLDLSRSAGKWSIRQIVHHIVDCELNYLQYDRYALSNTDRMFIFPDFSGDTWNMHMQYSNRPIELEIRFFSLIREYITHLCDILPESLDRTLKHEDGEFTVRQALEHDNAHAQHHIDQIIETRKIHCF
ncbi:DinB family protein [Paenibacillus gansuensis]|uniref:DinB family protein n=1 Tax=Paenibacillus gansuensis TaxID=306542 RepID=A0ABW5P8M0_9BACL